MTEKEKMLKGLEYLAYADEQLVGERKKAIDILERLNSFLDKKERDKLENKLLPNISKTTDIRYPFHCDYGYNIYIGENTEVNLNAYFMDGGGIFIGNNVFIGPNAGFYTVNHPIDYEERNKGIEKASPITIEDNVWLGGNVVVLPGITIGRAAVIGAGSVVTKDVKAFDIVAGNPAKSIKKN